MKVYIKFYFGVFLAQLFKLVGYTRNIVGISEFIRRFKTSDTLFVFAPGASVLNLSEADFRKIERVDSLSVNFFSLHPMNTSFYLAEPHDGRLNYFSEKQARKLHNKVFFKGYSTPKSFLNTLGNLRCASKNKIAMSLLKESGCYSIFDRGASQKLFSDSFSLGGNSLLYSLFLAYKTGYHSVVLCGFDMDAKYFYFEDNSPHLSRQLAEEFGLCNEKHNFVSNLDLRNKLLENLRQFQKKVHQDEKQFKIYTYKLKGPLNEIFDEFTFCVKNKKS